LMLEGLAEPARAWQVLGPSGIDSRFEALRTATTPLIGRDEELELLLRRWRQSAHGEGRVVLLSGEPGIGKSRLAVELQEQLQAELHTHLRHFCSPHHQDSALFPIIGWLEREAGFQRGDTDQQRLDKLEAVLAWATNDLGDAVPPIADLLSVSSGNRYPTLDLTPPKRKEKTLRALLAQLEGLAAHQPVLTVFEDVHWIDPTSLELLDLIVDRVPTLPVLVIITCRPEFAPTWVGRPHVTLLTLNRLPPSERAKMITEVAGGKALPREIADQIIDRTDGVPLFIEELTKTVVESGILVEAGDRYAVTGPGTPLSIPSTLQSSLLARLDRLPATREVAQIGAALGRSFSHELVSAVAEMPQQKLDDALAQLVRAELMFRRGTPPDAEYTFKHALVQDAAYSTLPRSRRQQIHARIATTLETGFPEIVAAQPQLMAQHCTEAGLNEKAVNYRLRAGQQAIARSAMAEAEALLRPGLALIASLPDNDWREEQELDLLITLARALIATHGWGAPEIGEAYARARELCDRLNRPRKLLPILYGQFVHHALRADLDKAQQLATEMRRLGETQNDVVARVMAYRVSGYASLAFGDFVTARDYLERSLGLYNPTDRAIFAELTPQDIVPTLLSFLACALVCSGHLDQARSRRDAALTEARRLSHAYTSAYARWWDWYVGWIARSEPGALLQSAEKLLALSVHGGLAFWRAMAIANRGWCLAALGQPEQGIPLVASGLREYHATGNTQFTPLLLTTLADAHRIAGNPQAGLKQLAEAERLAEATRERTVLSETLRLRGDLLLLTDDRGGAEASFTDAIAVARRQAARLFELRATTSLARLWRDQDKCAEARDLLAPVYGWFTEGFDTRDLREAKELLDGLPV
jgi:predicted ATPase